MLIRRSLLALTCLFLAFLSRVQRSEAEPIKLLAHQEKVTTYLKQNPDIHGLLLYHALGSGKTITALAYSQQQSLPTYVLVPEVLKAHWLKEMEKMGVKPEGVTLLSYNNKVDLEKIAAIDASKALIIIDEVHKFIENVRLSSDARYLNIYWSLIKAGKLLALSGTPVYNDASDIAYIGNLVMGQEVFAFHPDEFKSKYMRIDTTTSFFRGYFSESKWMASTLPIFATFVGISTAAVSGLTVPLFAMAGSYGLNYMNETFPIKKVSFREFDASLFADFSSKYISYYQANEEDKGQFPEVVIIPKEVKYSQTQTQFFLNFIDGNLAQKDLELLLKDYPHQYSPAMLYLNSAKIQRDILARPEAGREIGNLSLKNAAGTLELAPKFVQIEKIMRGNPGKTAVYSSYYHNGLKLFADFLRERKVAFEMIDPSSGVDEITRMLNDFNTGKNKVLLIHPEITEGISLVGVEQFHILEPVKNQALEKQIIGRSVRYRSHSLLPKERQKVAVYLWESTIKYHHFGFLPTEAGLLRNDHWRHKYREVNPNLWTNGITQLDTQYFMKDDTPDTRVIENKDNLTSDMLSFERVSAEHSLEKEKNYENSSALSSELKSPYAVPLLTFTYSKYQPYSLLNFKDGKKFLDVLEHHGYDFAIEIPHNNHLNFGFAQRWSTINSSSAVFGKEEKFGGFAMDLGFYNRAHYDWVVSPHKQVSLYWKNEVDTFVFGILPAYGLGLGVKESVGVQWFLTKHLGVDLAVAVDAKILKDTFIKEIDREDESQVEVKKMWQNLSWMRSLQPFVSLGVFSSYF